MGYRRRKLPFGRRFVIDSMALGERRHIVHGLVEVDVTLARSLIRQSEEDLSMTAFVAATVARTIAAHPIANGYRSFRGDLLVFDEVDVCVIVETETSDHSFPLPVVLRGAEARTVLDLTNEIRLAQSRPQDSENSPTDVWFGRLPGMFRRAIMRIAAKNPVLMTKRTGTAVVTSVGMFGETAGFGLPYPTIFTTSVLVGSIVTRHQLDFRGEVAPIDVMNLTLSFDHDIVDGGPAARFSRDLVSGLQEATALKPAVTDPGR